MSMSISYDSRQRNVVEIVSSMKCDLSLLYLKSNYFLWIFKFFEYNRVEIVKTKRCDFGMLDLFYNL